MQKGSILNITRFYSNIFSSFPFLQFPRRTVGRFSELVSHLTQRIHSKVLVDLQHYAAVLLYAES